MRGPLSMVTLSLVLGAVAGLALVWALAGPGELRYSDLPVVEAPLPQPTAAADRPPGPWQAASPGRGGTRAACGSHAPGGPARGAPEAGDRFRCDGADPETPLVGRGGPA